jgi:hypothetical protein
MVLVSLPPLKSLCMKIMRHVAYHTKFCEKQTWLKLLKMRHTETMLKYLVTGGMNSSEHFTEYLNKYK